jgi:hypothetical protein
MASAATQAEAARVNERLVKAQEKFTEPQVVGTQDNGSRFPVRLFRNTTEDDTKMQLLHNLKDSGFGQTVITDNVVDYFYKKTEEQEFAKKEAWLAESFDLSNPQTRDWLRRLEPGFFQRREEYAMSKLEAQKLLVKLSHHGPESSEDLDFLWHVASGHISLDDLRTPAWEQVPEDKDKDKGQFQRGLFNPRRWISSEAAVINYSKSGFVDLTKRKDETKPRYVWERDGNGKTRGVSSSNHSDGEIIPFGALMSRITGGTITTSVANNVAKDPRRAWM